MMHEEQFTKAAGKRDGVPSLAILITDGKPNPNIGKTVHYAEKARKDNITIISIGITKNVDKQQVSDGVCGGGGDSGDNVITDDNDVTAD